jgi:hypothetical protein
MHKLMSQNWPSQQPAKHTMPILNSLYFEFQFRVLAYYGEQWLADPWWVLLAKLYSLDILMTQPFLAQIGSLRRQSKRDIVWSHTHQLFHNNKKRCIFYLVKPKSTRIAVTSQCRISFRGSVKKYSGPIGILGFLPNTCPEFMAIHVWAKSLITQSRAYYLISKRSD